MDINKRSSSGEWIHLCNPYQRCSPLCYLTIQMCCFIPWQGRGLRMLLASECGRSRAQSAQSIFRSIFATIYFWIPMPSAWLTIDISIAQQVNKFALIQVEVPTSGSETIECGVCQHPFLVSARWIEFSFSRHAMVESSQTDKREVSPVQWSLMLNPAIPVCTLTLHGVCRCTLYMVEFESFANY
jgi:hypothetical protein